MRSIAIVIWWLASLIGVVTAAYAIFTPRAFHATALVHVDPRQQEVVPEAHYWVQSPFERVQSKLILYRVITNLNLQVKWADKYPGRGPLPVDVCYMLLKNDMIVSQRPGVPVVEITVSSHDALEAAAIANETATVFLADRLANISERKQERFKKQTGESLIIRDWIDSPKMVQRAEPALRPTVPNTILVIGGTSTALCLLLGGGSLIRLFRTRVDRAS